jgi:LPS sulfotransferase NodH
VTKSRAEQAGLAGDAVTPKLSYLICATPRSGSTFLCATLGNTGIAGHPEEHFQMLEETGRPRRPRDYFGRSNNPDVWVFLDDPQFQDILGDDRTYDDPTWPEMWGVSDFEGFLEVALQEGTTPNGVFGTKIMWAYFRDFVRLVRRMPGNEDCQPCEVPAAVFPNLRGFVFMSRRDTTRQAVSLWKALQTWRWRQDASEGDDSDKMELRYSFAAIDHLKTRINEHNEAWCAYFDRCGVEPLEVVYEELVDAYEENVLRVVRGLGIPVPDDFVLAKPKMQRQADELSEEWVRLYNEHKATEVGGLPRKV